MRNHYILRKLCIFGFLLAANFAKAQDLHYSQFYNSPLNLNPALTGIFNGDCRYQASLRDQWRFVPIPWFTMSGAYDFKIMPKKSDKYFFGLGANINYDRQGDSKISLAGLNLSGSYNRILNANNIISVGALLGFSTRGFDVKNLTWDKQWTGAGYDPNAASGESFDVSRIYFLETGLGLNYRLQKSERTKIDLGVGAYHLYQPTANFYNNEGHKLPMHLTFSAIGTIKLLDALDLQLQAMHQKQDKYNETLFGGLGKIYLSQKRGKELQLHLGLGYRTSNSLIPTLAIQYNEWYVSGSYDIDDTEFNQITSNGKGGPEFHIRYTIKKVQPLAERKICPIY